MKFKIHIILTMLTLSSVGISFGQNLEKHEWKQRVLIIASKNTNQLKQQLDSLTKKMKGLQERKLVVYQVTPKGYWKGTKQTNWTKSTNFYKDIKRKNSDFEVILLGLDGGVKLRQTKLLTTEKLFALIDGMPMRRQELKN